MTESSMNNTELFDKVAELKGKAYALDQIAANGYMSREAYINGSGMPHQVATLRLKAALKAATDPAPSPEKIRQLGEALRTFRDQSKFG